MTFIDLFCGMGTIRMGFEQAGHECVYSVEWDKHKRKIYEVIFGHEPQGRDIRELSADTIPRADCWTFGAPCQDFSIAGQRAGLDGDRSSLVREVFRLVRETPEEYRPKWLLYENVKGMLSSNKGLDYLEILFEMGTLGYDIEWQLLNSKDFGVPQNRERVFTLGHLRRRSGREVFPIGENDGIPDTESITKTGQSQAKYSTALRASGNMKADGTYIAEVKQIGNCMANGKRENPNQGRVYDTTGIAPCLSKMEGGGRQPHIVEPVATLSIDLKSVRSHTRRGMYKHEYTGSLDTDCYLGIMGLNSRIRRLTPRECMRLQGVPDYITNKLLSAEISDTQLYRAAGDACTVNVIYEIAKRMEV